LIESHFLHFLDINPFGITGIFSRTLALGIQMKGAVVAQIRNFIGIGRQNLGGDRRGDTAGVGDLADWLNELD
jgi:hypothetical protein